jgi:hypothetical protein
MVDWEMKYKNKTCKLKEKINLELKMQCILKPNQISNPLLLLNTTIIW